MTQNVAPKFVNDSSLQLTAPTTTAVSLLSLLVAVGEKEVDVLKLDTWSLDIEGVNIRLSTNGNSPSPTTGVRLLTDYMYPINETADRIMLVSTGAASKFNVSPGVLFKGFV